MRLSLMQWIALREVCKAFTDQVDRQPPFILLDPDIDTNALFDQFLTDATPDYAAKIAGMVGKIFLSGIFRRENIGEILAKIASVTTWERIEIRYRNSSFSDVVIPLLDALNHTKCTTRRKLSYSGQLLTVRDRAVVEEVLRSSSLQLTTLDTADVAEFLPFIAGNAKFRDLILDLEDSATLTRETFKAVREMQGSVKRLSLKSMGFIESNDVLNAFGNKGLESLTISSNKFKNAVDLLPWLTLPLRTLKLDAVNLEPATMAAALGITDTLITLEIDYGSQYWNDNDMFLFRENMKSLMPALRMNHTIERLSLGINSIRENFNFVLTDLPDVVLNHTSIKSMALNSGNLVWPELVAPFKPKSMDDLHLVMQSKGLIGMTNFFRHLSSLKRLRMEIEDCSHCNWEYLRLFSCLGMEEFSLVMYKVTSSIGKPMPFAECLSSGLNRLYLHIPTGYDCTGVGTALGGATALTSLELFNVDCSEMGDELVKGLVENKSLERFKLGLPPSSVYVPEIKQALSLAKIIEAVFFHPSISYAAIHCGNGDEEREFFLPEHFIKWLTHLKPTLNLELGDTTESPPDDASDDEIQAVSDIYLRLMMRYQKG